MSLYRFFTASFIGLSIIIMACSSKPEKPSAGIEIGNPSIAFTASFILDYGLQSNVPSKILSKAPADNEIMLIEGFRLDLKEVRSYSSYYVYVAMDPTEGLLLWPYASMPENSKLSINFGKDFKDGESFISKAFNKIDLQEEGLLKEIGLRFEPNTSSEYAIHGVLNINDQSQAFEFSLSAFKGIDLRYHHQQAELYNDSLNLPVTFHVNRWIQKVDLKAAESSEDGIIRFSETHNVDLWNSLNERFLSSFSCLRWTWERHDDTFVSDYVPEALNQFDIINKNWAENGDFSNGLAQWILVEQYSGTATTAIIKEKNNEQQLKVTVSNGSTQNYSVQLIHEDIPILENRKYKLIFTAWSNIEGPIVVRLGSYHLPYNTLGFQEKPIITKNGKSFEIEYFGAEDNTFARLEFNLGGQERQFWFKNIQVLRVD